MLLSKKEFIDFYKTEMEFGSIRGITASPAHKKDLQDMKHIYDISKDNQEFTEKMAGAGFGKI